MQGFKRFGVSFLSAHVAKWGSFLLVVAMIFLCQEQAAHATFGFSTTVGGMNWERQSHAATVLVDGRVLITGGMDGSFSATVVGNTAEIYNPLTGTFTDLGHAMNAARQSHTATRLADGRVLIIGGNITGSVATAEIFNPAGNGGAGSFAATASLPTQLTNFTATLLNNGTVLVAGGSSTLKTAYIFDPAGNGGAGAFTATGSLTITRQLHTATLLSSGNVLIVAGDTGGSTLTGSAEIYFTSGPNAGTFVSLAATLPPRDSAAAVLLSDNRVLIAGGFEAAGVSKTAYIFDPAGAGGAGTFTKTASDMNSGHYLHTVTRLLDNKVLIAGGISAFTFPSLTYTNAAEFFNPAAGGSFTAVSPGMTKKRASHSAVPLTDGSVLIAGGTGDAESIVTAEIYNPAVIAVSPAAFTFDNTFVTETSDAKTFTISNTGPASSSINLTGIAISGTDQSMFTVSSNTCGATLVAPGTCTVSVTFTPSTGGNKSASLVITSSDPERPTLSVPLTGRGVSLSPSVTVAVGGSGTGSVHSTPAGIACDKNGGAGCTSQFTFNTSVTLSPVGDANSLFSGWSCTTGDCSWLSACSGTGDCVIPSLQFDITANAAFTAVKPVKIHGTAFTFDTLTAAYASANTVNGSVIDARASLFAESPNFAGGKSITINGGYDLTFTTNSGFYSTVTGGSFTIGTGQITLSNIIVE